MTITAPPATHEDAGERPDDGRTGRNGSAQPRAVTPRPARHGPPRPALLVIGAFVLVAVVWGAYETWRAAQPPGPLTASGTVEADEVLVGAEVAARIVALPADEGRSVQAGDVLARLDDQLPRLQYQQADPATQRQLQVQLDRYTVRAPFAGVVTRVPVRVGEIASPGETLAAVADLGHLKLTLYVLERDLASVVVGQSVAVTADPFPGRTFSGVVTSINSSAEFTPRNVQTQRDRLNLVFGVKVRVDNPGGALKPGMPVDATFQ